MLSGCAGVYYTSLATHEVKCTSNCEVWVISKINGSRTLNSWPVTKENITSKLRQPDRVTKKNGMESWVYEERRWVGVMPVFLIPIPLMLPIGKDSVTYTFKANQFIEETSSTHIKSGYICSIILPIGNSGKLCDTDNVSTVIDLEDHSK